MAKQIVAGNYNMVIYVDGVPMMCAESASLKLASEEIEISCMGAGAWKQIAMGQKNWSISSSAVFYMGDDVIMGVFEFAQLLIDATEVVLQYSTNVVGDKYFEGSAFVVSEDVNSSSKDKGAYSVNFTGNGILEIKTVV